jgi:hypothetical protein
MSYRLGNSAYTQAKRLYIMTILTKVQCLALLKNHDQVEYTFQGVLAGARFLDGMLCNEGCLPIDANKDGLELIKAVRLNGKLKIVDRNYFLDALFNRSWDFVFNNGIVEIEMQGGGISHDSYSYFVK